MTEKQRAEVLQFLTETGGGELHHGDCVGVDVEVAEIAAELGFTTVNHPPLKDSLRAWHKSDQFREPFGYFARNRNIVDEVDMLLVIPYQTQWQDNGGTWYTHDYAIKQKKPYRVVWPAKLSMLEDYE